MEAQHDLSPRAKRLILWIGVGAVTAVVAVAWAQTVGVTLARHAAPDDDGDLRGRVGELWGDFLDRTSASRETVNTHLIIDQP